MWSEMPFSVHLSYVMGAVASLVHIRSIQDVPVFLQNVLHAGGPGCKPFRIYHPYCSYSSIAHVALGPTILSSLYLGMWVSPIFGASDPILVFQSPHTTDVVDYGMLHTISSTSSMAVFSGTPRLVRFCRGGRYTFPTHSLSPPLTYRHTHYAYSFALYCIILIPYLIRSARPPLDPFYRLLSYT